MSSINDTGIRSIFVYGSLRPDDDSGMPWTKEACDGMNYCKAIVKDHCMYIDTYASVKSNKNGKKPMFASDFTII